MGPSPMKDAHMKVHNRCESSGQAASQVQPTISASTFNRKPGCWRGSPRLRRCLGKIGRQSSPIRA